MFEPIADTDVPAVAALMNRAYRGSGPGAGWTTEGAYLAGDRTTPALLRAEPLAKPQGVLLKWIERSGDELTGCV